MSIYIALLGLPHFGLTQGPLITDGRNSNEMLTWPTDFV